MGSKITVMGSFVVDLMGRAPHIPTPGETVKGSFFKMGPGGKGCNQGVASKKSGGDVTMITRVGDDNFKSLAEGLYKDAGFDPKYIFVDKEGNSTAVAPITVDEITGQNAIAVYLGACDKMTTEEVDSVADVITSSDILLMQLELSMDATIHAKNLAVEAGVKVLLNPAPTPNTPIPEELYDGLYCIMPNEVEAAQISGIPTDTNEGIEKAAQFFHDKGVKNVIITLGVRGSYVSTPETKAYVPIIKVKGVDTTGAGDAFCGGLVTALSEGKNLVDAAKFGAVTSGLKVTRMGSSVAMATREEIDAYMAENKF